MVTIANGGDNIAVYVPLFARRSILELATMGATFFVLVAVWCSAAWRVRTLPLVARVLDRWGHVLAPIVLIGLGVYILANAAVPSR